MEPNEKMQSCYFTQECIIIGLVKDLSIHVSSTLKEQLLNEVIYGKRVTWKSRGYFFHENPPNPIGDTQKYQKKVEFLVENLLFMSVFGAPKMLLLQT